MIRTRPKPYPYLRAMYHVAVGRNWMNAVIMPNPLLESMGLDLRIILNPPPIHEPKEQP
jgi:hypothetical protein